MVTGAKMVPGVRRGGVAQPSSMILWQNERHGMNGQRSEWKSDSRD